MIGAIALGGALGALLRFGISVAALAVLPEWTVAGTLTANVLGSFVIGLVAAWVVRRGMSIECETFLITGFCGGFTTFSAFSLETMMMVVGGDWIGAGVYLVVSVVAWLAAVWAGWRAGAALARR